LGSIKIFICILITCLAAVGWSASIGVEPGKVLTRFQRIFPSAKSVAIIYSDPGSETYVLKAEAAAKKQGLNFTAVRIKAFEDIPPSIRSLFNKIDALWLVDDPLISQPNALNYLLLNAVQQRWKTIVLQEDWVRRGGLFYLTEGGEAVINRGIMKCLGLEVPEDAGLIRYIGEEKK